MKFNLMITTILCCLTASCMKWGNCENSRLIEQAQQLIAQIPDSALTLLDMANTFSFGNAKKAEYTLLRVQARSNAGMDLSTDTEIFQALEYFIRKNNTEKAAWAGFYAGLVAGYSDAYRGIEYFMTSLQYAQKAELKLLQGKILYNIGNLNYDNLWFDNAITRYQQAFQTFHALEDQYLLEVHSLNAIANAMLLNHQTDSAQYYYQQALDQAYLHEDTTLLVMVYNNLGAVYREQGQADKATDYSRRALQLAANDEKIHIYLNLVHIFHDQNQLDSARYYIEQAETLLSNIDDIWASASLSYLRYQIEKTDGNYPKALEYFEFRSDQLIEMMENNDRKLLLEMQKKYDFTTKENELNKKRSRALELAGFMLMFLFVLAVFFIYVLRKSMKQKEELTRVHVENIEKQLALEHAEWEKIKKTLELENALQQAKTLQKMYNQKDSDIKTKFLNKMGILKKVALLSPYLADNMLKDRPEELKIVLKARDIVKDLDIENFIKTANEVFPGFTDKLKQLCNELDEREISICCLILFDFSNQELDLFINHRLKGSLNSIQTWKTAIRRKLNIPSHGDIKTYLLEKIDENE